MSCRGKLEDETCSLLQGKKGLESDGGGLSLRSSSPVSSRVVLAKDREPSNPGGVIVWGGDQSSQSLIRRQETWWVGLVVFLFI